MIWRHCITYREPSAPAVAFLAANPGARELIEQAYPVLQGLFGDDIKPELEFAHGNFVVNIPWAGGVDDGLELMDRFDDKWWLDRLRDDMVFMVRCL